MQEQAAPIADALIDLTAQRAREIVNVSADWANLFSDRLSQKTREYV